MVKDERSKVAEALKALYPSFEEISSSFADTDLQKRVTDKAAKLFYVWKGLLKSARGLLRLMAASGVLSEEGVDALKRLSIKDDEGRHSGMNLHNSSNPEDALLDAWVETVKQFQFPSNVHTFISSAIKVTAVMSFGPTLKILMESLEISFPSGQSGDEAQYTKQEKNFQAGLHVCLCSVVKELVTSCKVGRESNSKVSTMLKVLLPPQFHCLNLQYAKGTTVEVLQKTHPQAVVDEPCSASIAGFAFPSISDKLGPQERKTVPPTVEESSRKSGGSASAYITRRTVEETKVREDVASLLCLRLKYNDEIDSLSPVTSSGLEGVPWYPRHLNLASDQALMRATCLNKKSVSTYTNQMPKSQAPPPRKKRDNGCIAQSVFEIPNFYSEILYVKQLMVVAQRLFSPARGSVPRAQTSYAQLFAMCASHLASTFLPEQDFKVNLQPFPFECAAFISNCVLAHHKSLIADAIRYSVWTAVNQGATQENLQGDGETPARPPLGLDPQMCELFGLAIALLPPNSEEGVGLPLLFDTLVGLMKNPIQAVEKEISSAKIIGESIPTSASGLYGGVIYEVGKQRENNVRSLCDALLTRNSVFVTIMPGGNTGWMLFERLCSNLKLDWNRYGKPFTVGGTRLVPKNPHNTFSFHSTDGAGTCVKREKTENLLKEEHQEKYKEEGFDEEDAFNDFGPSSVKAENATFDHQHMEVEEGWERPCTFRTLEKQFFFNANEFIFTSQLS